MSISTPSSATPPSARTPDLHKPCRILRLEPYWPWEGLCMHYVRAWTLVAFLALRPDLGDGSLARQQRQVILRHPGTSEISDRRNKDTSPLPFTHSPKEQTSLVNPRIGSGVSTAEKHKLVGLNQTPQAPPKKGAMAPPSHPWYLTLGPAKKPRLARFNY